MLVALYEEAKILDIDTTDIEKVILENVIHKDVLMKALLRLIAVRNLPFNCVTWPELHLLASALNPQSSSAIPTAPITVVKALGETFLAQQDLVRKKLQAAITPIHIAVDIWTSPNRILFLAVCAHFVDEDDVVSKCLLALPTVSGHSGRQQWEVLHPVLREYGIENRLGAIISDNSDTNDKLCCEIASYMAGRGLSWSAESHRLRCLGHIINLAVQDFLFLKADSVDVVESYEEQEREGKALTEQEEDEKSIFFRQFGVLGKLHNIIVYSRASAGRKREFEQAIGRESIPLDNRTRWNSWWNLLDAALKVEAKIDTYVKNNLAELKNDLLSAQDWIQLQTIWKFLGVFKRSTLVMEGDYFQLDRVHVEMEIMMAWIAEVLVRNYLCP